MLSEQSGFYDGFGKLLRIALTKICPETNSLRSKLLIKIGMCATVSSRLTDYAIGSPSNVAMSVLKVFGDRATAFR